MTSDEKIKAVEANLDAAFGYSEFTQNMMFQLLQQQANLNQQNQQIEFNKLLQTFYDCCLGLSNEKD